MMIDISLIVLCFIGLILWCVMMWTIGFKQGKQEGYTAGYMKGRTVGRSSVDTK